MYTLVLNIVKTIIFTYLYRRMSQLELYSNKCNPFQATPTIYRFLISSLKIMEHISGKTFRIFFSPVLSLFKPAQVSLGSPNARIAYPCPPGCQFLPPPPPPCQPPTVGSWVTGGCATVRVWLIRKPRQTMLGMYCVLYVYSAKSELTLIFITVQLRRISDLILYSK